MNKDERLRKAREDPKNAGKYLLTPKELDKINKAFSEYEHQLMAGDDDGIFKFLPGHPDNPFNILHDILQKKESDEYMQLFMQWLCIERDRIAEKTGQIKRITEFYEESTFIPSATLAHMTEDTNLTAKIFERQVPRPDSKKQKDMLYIRKANWSRMSSTYDEKRGMAVMAILLPELTTESEEEWTGDYKSLTDRILETKKTNSIILMKTYPEISDYEKRQALTAIIAPYFLEKGKPKE